MMFATKPSWILLLVAMLGTVVHASDLPPPGCASGNPADECLHGGTCVGVDTSSGAIEYRCDCTTAYTNLASYAGRTCQYQSTIFCKDETNPHTEIATVNFCTNGGACGNRSIDDCICQIPYEGPHCEFVDGNAVDEAHHGGGCDLDCKNGGVCKEGANDLSTIQDIAPELLPDWVAHNEDFEHCACRQGFGGLKCEVALEICGEGKHLCLHGSQCVPNGRDGNVYSCDCESADIQDLAGIHCQHASTMTCDEPDDGFVQGNRGFCVNGGECAVNTRGRGHCKCVGPWHGPHCEFHENSEHPLAQKKGNNNSGPSNAALAVIMVVTLLIGLALGVFLARRCMGKQ